MTKKCDETVVCYLHPLHGNFFLCVRVSFVFLQNVKQSLFVPGERTNDHKGVSRLGFYFVARTWCVTPSMHLKECTKSFPVDHHIG